MFGSLFSNRYNNKRKMFYAQYEETRQRFPNLPIYRRAAEPVVRKSFKCGRKKRKHVDYDYDEWIAGHFVPIVERRAVENWSCCQLMEPLPSDAIDVCSWRCWPKGDEDDVTEPRRSLRLTAKPNLSQSDIGKPSQLDTNDAIKWQQQLPAANAKATSWPTLEAFEEQPALTFIDGCQLASRLECKMCCKHFGQDCDLQRHSLDDCRKYLLATLTN